MRISNQVLADVLRGLQPAVASLDPWRLILRLEHFLQLTDESMRRTLLLEQLDILTGSSAGAL